MQLFPTLAYFFNFSKTTDPLINIFGNLLIIRQFLDIKKCKNDYINTLKHVIIYIKLIYSYFVASSVTIDDKLRIRIKLLAAKFDTTQGEIINQAVTLFEEAKNQSDGTAIESSREIIKKDLLKHKTPTWRKKIRTKLQESGIDIDDLRIELNEI